MPLAHFYLLTIGWEYVGGAGDAGDAQSTGDSEDVCNALPPSSSSASGDDVPKALASRRCEGSVAATISRKAKPRRLPFGRHGTARPDLRADPTQPATGNPARQARSCARPRSQRLSSIFILQILRHVPFIPYPFPICFPAHLHPFPVCF